MPTSYPGSIDTLARPSAAAWMDDPGYEGDVVIDNLADAIEATETKLGTGGAAPPASAAVLRRTGTGASGWGLIATGDITAAACSQSSAVQGSAANPSTASTSAVLMTDMTLAMTTTGGPVLVLFTAAVSAAIASTAVIFEIYLDGAPTGTGRQVSPSAAGETVIVPLMSLFVPSAGAHTFTIRWYVAGPAGAATSSGTQRSMTVVEFKR
jgi:hypothetical protein